METNYIQVTVTKTAMKGDIEYAHIRGPHGLEMWMPTSELLTNPKTSATPAKGKATVTKGDNTGE